MLMRSPLARDRRQPPGFIRAVGPGAKLISDALAALHPEFESIRSPAVFAQHDALSAVGCERTFSEQVSSVGKREQLEAAISFARDGDTFVITRLDRLARSTQDLLSIVERLHKKGVALRILDFAGSAIDTTKAVDKLLIIVFGAFAEFERNLMLERQREGIAKAKAEGKYRGRAPTARSKTDQIRAFGKEWRLRTRGARQ